MFQDDYGFRAPFKDLFHQLLPKEVRDELKRAVSAAQPDIPPSLKIFLTPGAEWIPWELLHDGVGFLGLRFAVARLPIVRAATEVRGPRARSVRNVCSLLAKDVLQGQVLDAWHTTFAGYSNANPEWKERRFPDGNGSGYPTLNQFDDARNADLVHITCHAGLKDGNEYYWTLDHENTQYFNYRINTAFAEGVELEERPLVFGNGCASAATSNVGALHGFGASFMIGGALNFVGTFAPVTKTMAVTFASDFYRNLLGAAGAPGPAVAEALWATKQKFSRNRCADPSYLFYCLYGPPDATYAPA